jgi:hypothetical protein
VIRFDLLRDELNVPDGVCECEPDINYQCDYCYAVKDAEGAQEILLDLDHVTGIQMAERELVAA